MTWNDFYRYFQQKIDKAYSNYVDPVKANRIILDAYTRCVEEAIRMDGDQKKYDYLSEITKIDQIFTVNNNKIYISPLQVFNVSLGVNTATFTTFKPHNLLTGDQATISGITGFAPDINQSYAITFISDTSFQVSYTGAGIYTPNQGNVTSPKIIGDYYRYKYAQCKFLKVVSTVRLIVSEGGILTVIGSIATNLRNGEIVVIDGVLGATNANGQHYVKVRNDYKFALYQDAELTIPVTLNAPYISSPNQTISKLYYSAARVIESDEKNSIFNDATVRYPTIQVADKYLFIQPGSVLQIRIDYYTMPKVVINVNENTIDLLNFYALPFLQHWIDRSAQIFDQMSRDGEQYQIMTNEVIQNP